MYKPRLAFHLSPGSPQWGETSVHFLDSSPFEQSVRQCRFEELIRRKSLSYPETENRRKVQRGKRRQGEQREIIQERGVFFVCSFFKKSLDSFSSLISSRWSILIYSGWYHWLFSCFYCYVTLVIETSGFLLSLLN